MIKNRHPKLRSVELFWQERWEEAFDGEWLLTSH